MMRNALMVLQRTKDEAEIRRGAFGTLDYRLGGVAVCENWDLFYGYRKSLGEGRTLFDEPVHILTDRDHQPFASL